MDVPGPRVCGWINGEDGSMVVISPTYKWDVLGLQPTDIPGNPSRPFIELALGKDVILLVGIYDQQFQGTISFNGL